MMAIVHGAVGAASGGDAGRPDDGGPEQVAAPVRVVLGDRLAGVQANAHADGIDTTFRRRTNLQARSW